jgi:hypothetical protein
LATLVDRHIAIHDYLVPLSCRVALMLRHTTATN